MVSKRWLWVSGVVMIAAAVAVTVFAQQPTLVGTFQYAGNAQEAADLRTALLATTQPLDSEARTVWAGQLEEMARPAQRLTFARDGLNISLQSGTTNTLRSRTDGVTAAHDSERDLSQELDGNTLTQEVSSDDMLQQYTYSLSTDGQTLSVDVRISGTELSQPFEYTLTYSRM